MEKQPSFKPRKPRDIFEIDDPKRTIFLGKNVFVKPNLDGVEIVKYSPGLPNALKSTVSLGATEFRQLLVFSNVLLSALKKTPEQAKTVAEYDALFRHQSKFLLGTSVYVKVSYFEHEPLVQFIEYIMINSLTVSEETVVCPYRCLLGLNHNQFEELLLHRALLKSEPKRKAVRKEKNETEASDSTKSGEQKIPVLISDRSEIPF